MRALLAALLLLTLAFAGCADGDKGGDDGTSSSGSSSGSKSGSASGTGTASGTASGTGTGSATATGSGAPSANLAPIANLSANLTAGAAPLSVNFTLDGSDADGQALSWSLDFGDGSVAANGTTLPAFAMHAFTVAGTFVAVLNVTDGQVNVSANVTINVTAPPAGTPLHYQLATILPCTDCYFSPLATGMCAEFTAGEPKGLRCDWAQLPPEAAGRAFVLAGGSDPGLEFYSACAGDASSLGAQDETADTEVGTVPAGAGCVVVYDFETLMAEYTFDVA